MKSSKEMEDALVKYSGMGLITVRSENNPHLKISYKGAGKDISEKWNVKIYSSGSVVTTDLDTLMSLVEGTFKAPNTSLKVIQIDDAGIGFPLCGIMIGIYDGVRIHTETVDVSLFQGIAYESKEYVSDYTTRGLNIIKRLCIKPKTHRIEICSGFINQSLKAHLRSLGFEVSITDIKGPLQDQLENLYKRHVSQLTREGLGYDPKGMTPNQIANNYNNAVEWGRRHAPHLLKTGWKALQ